MSNQWIKQQYLNFVFANSGIEDPETASDALYQMSRRFTTALTLELKKLPVKLREDAHGLPLFEGCEVESVDTPDGELLMCASLFSHGPFAPEVLQALLSVGEAAAAQVAKADTGFKLVYAEVYSRIEHSETTRVALPSSRTPGPAIAA